MSFAKRRWFCDEFGEEEVVLVMSFAKRRGFCEEFGDEEVVLG